MPPEVSPSSLLVPARIPVQISAHILRQLVDVSADGLFLVSGARTVLWMNSAAERLVGYQIEHPDVRDLVAQLTCTNSARGRVGEVQRATWVRPGGRPRHLDYRTTALDDGGFAIWLSDVTEQVRQQERITAITRAAASVADTFSLRATLDAVADEIATTAGISAVQIHAFDDPYAEVRVLGMAGFGDAPEFTTRLAEARQLGARMLAIESFNRRERMVSPHRKPAIMADPAWAPLHEIMGRPDWDTFVAVPLCVRGRVLGAVNAYYEPGENPSPASLSFLEAMADHAAVAMDTAKLLASTRSQARSDERRRLARDLHDSAVQQVFSMRLQAEALLAQLDGHLSDTERVRDRVGELAGLATNALSDLRALLLEMRPFDITQGGLADAIRASAGVLEDRHGLLIEVDARNGFDSDMDPDVQEDVFRIVQEALHNVVKHASAKRVHVSVVPAEIDGYAWVVETSDDGCARVCAAGSQTWQQAGGLGLTSMQERAESWGGHVEAGPRADGGWAMRAFIPHGLTRSPGQVDNA